MTPGPSTVQLLEVELKDAHSAINELRVALARTLQAAAAESHIATLYKTALATLVYKSGGIVELDELELRETFDACWDRVLVEIIEHDGEDAHKGKALRASLQFATHEEIVANKERLEAAKKPKPLKLVDP